MSIYNKLRAIGVIGFFLVIISCLTLLADGYSTFWVVVASVSFLMYLTGAIANNIDHNKKLQDYE